MDCDYRGPIKVLLFNYGSDVFRYKKGDRIGQLVLVPCVTSYPLQNVETLEETERGEKGFGSTGTGVDRDQEQNEEQKEEEQKEEEEKAEEKEEEKEAEKQGDEEEEEDAQSAKTVSKRASKRAARKKPVSVPQDDPLMASDGSQ